MKASLVILAASVAITFFPRSTHLASLERDHQKLQKVLRRMEELVSSPTSNTLSIEEEEHNVSRKRNDDDEEEEEEESIPKLLHFTWKTDDLSAIPKHFRDFHLRWKEVNPNWEAKIWTEDDILVLVER